MKDYFKDALTDTGIFFAWLAGGMVSLAVMAGMILGIKFLWMQEPVGFNGGTIMAILGTMALVASFVFVSRLVMGPDDSPMS